MRWPDGCAYLACAMAISAQLTRSSSPPKSVGLGADAVGAVPEEVRMALAEIVDVELAKAKIAIIKKADEWLRVRAPPLHLRRQSACALKHSLIELHQLVLRRNRPKLEPVQQRLGARELVRARGQRDVKVTEHV